MDGRPQDRECSQCTRGLFLFRRTCQHFRDKHPLGRWDAGPRTSESLPSTWKVGASSPDQVPRGVSTGGDPHPPPHSLVTYRQGRLQSVSRYHFHGQARIRENVDRLLHAGPRRVDDSDETQERQLPQLGPRSQGQHCGQSKTHRRLRRFSSPVSPSPTVSQTLLYPRGAWALSPWTAKGRDDLPGGRQAHAGQRLPTAHPRWRAGQAATTCPAGDGPLSTGGAAPKGSGHENTCGLAHKRAFLTAYLSLLCPPLSLPADSGQQPSRSRKTCRRQHGSEGSVSVAQKPDPALWDRCSERGWCGN